MSPGWWRPEYRDSALLHACAMRGMTAEEALHEMHRAHAALQAKVTESVMRSAPPVVIQVGDELPPDPDPLGPLIAHLRGDFPPDPPEYQEALRMWCEYHCDTETYDRGLPHARGPGGAALVLGSDLRDRSQRYAVTLMTALLRERHRRGVPDDVWSRARRESGTMTAEDCARLLGRTLPPLRDAGG